jgi:flagellin-like protein
MNFKQFMKNRRAISPIFATLILIAIAVIAGVVVYMFTSGTLATMTNGGTAAQEKAAVQGLSVNANGTAFTVYAQSTGNAVVNIKSEIFKDASGTTIGVANVAATLTADGSLIKISSTGTVAFSPTQSIGSPITVTLVGENGGSFVSSGVPAI